MQQASRIKSTILQRMAIAGVMAAPALARAAELGAVKGKILSSDGGIGVILAFVAILMVVVLVRMRQLHRAIEAKSTALDRSEQHFRIMGDNLPNETLFQLVCAPGNRFDFSYITKGYERILGIDRRRVIQDAKLAFDHIYESDIPVLQAAHRNALENLDPAELELRVLDISGNLKWLRISAVPHLEGKNLIWNGFMQDITGSKSVEEALVEEKRNLQNLFGTIDDFLLVFDVNGNLLHTNPSVERRLEYAASELRTMSLFELYPEGLRAEAYQVVAVMQSETSTTSNLPLQMKHGGTIPVEMNLFQGRWKDRKAIFGVARDIGGRQQAEVALRESQQMLQLIMNTIPMAVFWTDKDSVYLGCNQTFMKACGLDRTEKVVGATPFDLFDQETSALMIAQDQHVINTNKPQLNDLRSFTRPDSSIGWRETSRIPLRDENDHAVGVLTVWRDVTEQRRAEERLKRTLDDMERFNQLMRGRERRTLELKDEINQLLQEMGRQIKYQTTLEGRE